MVSLCLSDLLFTFWALWCRPACVDFELVVRHSQWGAWQESRGSEERKVSVLFLFIPLSSFSDHRPCQAALPTELSLLLDSWGHFLFSFLHGCRWENTPVFLVLGHSTNSILGSYTCKSFVNPSLILMCHPFSAGTLIWWLTIICIRYHSLQKLFNIISLSHDVLDWIYVVIK